MTDLVSIIVPVYKTPIEAFDRLLASLRSQSYSDIEIVIVDDGNEDAYASKLDKRACFDRRIRVLHQGNGGVSRARNLGFAASTGEFVMFADADDEIMPKCIEEALTLLERHDLDIVYGRYLKKAVERQEVKTEPVGSDVRVLEGKELAAVSQCFFSHEHPRNCNAPHAVSCGPCGRLFRRAIVEFCPFDERMDMCEDAVFNAEVVMRAKRIGFVDNVWYVYYQNSYSIYHNLAFDDRFDNHKVLAEKHALKLPHMENALYAQVIHRFLCTTRILVRRKGMGALLEVHKALRHSECRSCFKNIDLDDFDLSLARVALYVAGRYGLALLLCLAYRFKGDDI